MKLHRLKIYDEYLDEVKRGNKRFELRFDDRGYERGDFVEFLPWPGHYFRITYVLHPRPGLGLKDGWVVFGFEEAVEVDHTIDLDKEFWFRQIGEGSLELEANGDEIRKKRWKAGQKILVLRDGDVLGIYEIDDFAIGDEFAAEDGLDEIPEYYDGDATISLSLCEVEGQWLEST